MNSSTPLPEVDSKALVPPSTDPAPESGGNRYVALWRLLAVAIIACDALVSPLLQGLSNQPVGMLLALLCTGVVIAQGGLLSAYIVWGGRPFWVRLVVHWLAALVLYGIWLVGMLGTMLLGDWRPVAEIVRREAVYFWCLVPYFALAIQTPLWASRLLAGWRITRESGEPERAWSIADFLVATALVAVALTLLRASGGNAAEIWAMAVISGSIVAGLNAMVLLPTAWLVLGMTRLGTGLPWLLGYYLFLVLATITAIYLIIRAQTLGEANSSILDYAFQATLLVATLGTVFTTFVLLRLSGYRLHRGRAARGPEPIAIVEKALD